MNEALDGGRDAGDDERPAAWAATYLADARADRVELSSLTFGGSPRRSALNAAHVRVLTELAPELPAIIVHEPTLRVIDGAHRVKAAVLRGEQSIAAKFVTGSDQDLFVLAVHLNSRHGLPLEFGDRIAAAQRILTSHPLWSDRRIATVAGISAATVAAYRRHAPSEGSQQDVRIGKDGRARPVHGAQGRREATRILLARPDATLREVAREAGIALSTAHDVRRRIREGRDPVGPVQPRASDPACGALIGEAGAESVAAAASGRLGVTTVAVYPAARRPSRSRTPLSPQDLDVAVARLRADPSVRMTEAGRGLLRILEAERAALAAAADLLERLPGHCGATVAEILTTYASEWGGLADRSAGSERVG